MTKDEFEEQVKALKADYNDAMKTIHRQDRIIASLRAELTEANKLIEDLKTMNADEEGKIVREVKW